MNTNHSVKPPGNSKKSTAQQQNPFARALAESEQGAYASDKNQPQAPENENPFGQALANAGGLPKDFDPQQLFEQQAHLEAERKKKELHKKLHDQVNPVDQQEVFSAERERTKQELEEVRKELKALATELAGLYKDIDVQTTQAVTDQGISGGIGLKTYFQKLREFIMLLTQKVKSARTWLNAQSSKKKRKIRGGVMMGRGNQESKAVFDMMHHERSNAYSGA